ncbi:MAG: alpha/beta fold hydrolase [Paramuribaculum sp.]|nr:alpha/beta fold hydrolase [Paramuribaculum sp.]
MNHILKPLLTITTCVGITLNASGKLRETELIVTASDGVKMGATLTEPDSSTRLRGAIVLATGSGTQNRDEELFGKKPFKTIAEYLTPLGYAVLRVDDRGLFDPEEKRTATLQTYADDVAAAVTLTDSLFPTTPIGIIGHSAGGTYALINGTHNPKVKFIVTLAGPAWSGDSIVMAQSRAIATQMTGKWDAEERQRRLLQTAKSSLPETTARLMMTMILNESVDKETASLPQVIRYFQQEIDAMLSPWYRSFLRYEPADDIKNIKIPALALIGSKDLQVPSANLTTINTINPDINTQIMDGHNHLFQKCVTGLTDEYATLPGDISDETLTAISLWLDEILP